MFSENRQFVEVIKLTGINNFGLLNLVLFHLPHSSSSLLFLFFFSFLFLFSFFLFLLFLFLFFFLFLFLFFFFFLFLFLFFLLYSRRFVCRSISWCNSSWEKYQNSRMERLGRPLDCRR